MPATWRASLGALCVVLALSHSEKLLVALAPAPDSPAQPPGPAHITPTKLHIPSPFFFQSVFLSV